MRDLFECSWFLEQVCGPGNDGELMFDGQSGCSLPIKLDDMPVVLADEQQNGRLNSREALLGQVRASATGYH